MSEKKIMHWCVFLKDVKKNKIYIQALKVKMVVIKTVQANHYKILHLIVFGKKKVFCRDNLLILYVFHLVFGKTNTNIHITNTFGDVKYGCSAGQLSFFGKDKKRKNVVTKPMLNTLFKKSFILKEKPFAIHLTNAKSFKQHVLKYLKNRRFIQVLRDFNPYPCNGCRKRKLARKKFKKIKRYGWVWFKAANCKFVRFFCHVFESHFL